jgi:sulfur-oxidizing protein SoxY
MAGDTSRHRAHNGGIKGIPMRIAHSLASLASVALIGSVLSADPAVAGSAWEDIRPSAFGARPIADGREVLVFKAPYRAEDQRAVPISVEATFTEGRKVKSVTFIVDENPAPVAAVFRFGDERSRVALSLDIRLDHASPIRVVVETHDGALYMSEKFVKASGLGVCAAPPLGDPQVAARTMGQMRLTDLTARDETTRFRRLAELDIRHPQHTGMQMNQVTMLYLPARFISAIEVRQGEQTLFDLEGSITLSENPRIAFDYQVNGADVIRVRAKDSSNSFWEQDFPIGSGS